MATDSKDDGYIPLMDRFIAWWEGIEPEAIVRAKKASGPTETDEKALEAPKSPATIEVDIPDSEGPMNSWPETRLTFCRRLWGEEFEVVRPGGTEFTVRLVRPMALTAENNLVDLSVGLGGGARKVHSELGVWVAGYERNPDLAKHGARISNTKGLDRKVKISSYDPATLELKPGSANGVLIREILYTISDRVTFLEKVAAAVRPLGHIVLTDLMLAKEEFRKDKAVLSWLKRDAADASPELVGAYTPMLEEMGFDVRVEEDESDTYHGYVLESWAAYVAGLQKEDLDRETVSRMILEAEYWVYLMRVLQARKVRLFRLHAIKKA